MPIIHSSNKANNAVQHLGLGPKTKQQAFKKKFGIVNKVIKPMLAQNHKGL